MAWSGITSVVTYSAGNAIPVTNTGAEPISVTVKRPASGEDVIVTFYADGAPVHTMTTSATDPIKTSSFSAPGATALNYSTDRAFASPGASISASTEASAPSSTPSGDVAVAGAIIAESFELSGGSPVGGSSRVLKHSGMMKQANHLTNLAPLVLAADSTIFAKLQVNSDQSTFTVLLENYGSSPLVYDNVSCRAGGNGTQGTTFQLTKDGSTTITVPAASVAITGTGDVKNGVPGIVELDIPINNNADNLNSTTATAPPFFVYLRAHTTSGGTIQTTSASGDANYLNGGGSGAGDLITGWPAVTYLTTNYPTWCCLRPRYKTPVVTILGLGDSHLASEGWFAAAVAAANAATTGREMIYFKQGFGGVGSATIRKWGELYIPVVMPDFVYMPWGTFNDGSSTAIRTSRQNIRALTDLCESLGVGIVTSTPHPLDGNAGGSFVTQTNLIADELLAAYPDCVDVYALTGVRATATFLAGMSSDGTHLNETGRLAVQPAFNALFTRILQR